jgi:hypothetical protein
MKYIGEIHFFKLYLRKLETRNFASPWSIKIENLLDEN